MRVLNKYDTVKAAILAVSLALVCSGCASRSVTRTESEQVMVPNSQDIPGVVEYVWEEPMVDVVDVPPGLDPEGHYYRPAHQEVVEIRQGRWNYYKKNNRAE